MTLVDKRNQLLAVAREQGGYFTASQAAEVGFDNAHQHLRVKAGEWTRVRRGIYRLSSEPESQHEDLHVLALLFRRRDGSHSGVFGMETAAALHNIGLYMPAKVHILVEPAFKTTVAVPSVVELTTAPSIVTGVTYLAGLPLTTPLRTVVDLLMAPDRSLEEVRRAYKQARSDGILSRKTISDLSSLPERAAEQLTQWEKENE